MNKLLRFSTFLFFSFMLMNSTSIQAADHALTDNQGAGMPDANVISSFGKSGNSNSGISFSGDPEGPNTLYLISAPKTLDFGQHGQFTTQNWDLLPQKDSVGVASPQDNGVAIADFRLGNAKNWNLSVQSTAFSNLPDGGRDIQPISSIAFRNADVYNGKWNNENIVYTKESTQSAYTPIKTFDFNHELSVSPNSSLSHDPINNPEFGQSAVILTSRSDSNNADNIYRGRGIWLLAFNHKKDIVLHPTKSEIPGNFRAYFRWILGTDSTQALS